MNNSNVEEVRINQHTFKFLIDNHLWYVEGKSKAFKDEFVVNFPTNAREVKANWVRSPANVADRYVTAL